MKQTLHHIVSSIVNNEKEVAIEENEQETQEAIVSYVIHVAKEDMGKVIGKEGKIIRSIRNVMKIPAIKQGKRIQISIAEQAE
ncbi:MAG: hypothetical protein A3F31_01685 [Candidatus Levybacteria bacterium RIFCSPHIGHO2_12_FULL_38_12]|nr:MAG: hypothetical protein A2770_02570 [Candidatus Levybacteria bacterium RIFCSPHIGHO2_01_FULL_38_12]OGH22066.1 MAG: hypothetical protein A3D75_01540 [Candidatus Levybacteria bacterium RIFCSPHIGHO2_02_FULL_37_18]OGH22918.1 MAG: hypothetical protein A3F31_01685 [Candidatus Levybacteria bacterium RIFCSPHIGHO2_12_FULL_38_12]OGH34038.1 MAG: hypothetical protein A3A47_00145 [Candidatus Levybacteria bacterium RIFCSPLOWO2_01_FULL_37_20]OGH44898.1 MAG: hypothetical protein A3J14_02655 [Candidatus Lev